MQNFAVFNSPSNINYGRGAFEAIGTTTAQKGTKALIVSDKMMNKLGNVSQCREHLTKSGVESIVYLGVESEPTDIYVAEAIDMFQKEECDVIISLGGGSCIDTAKSVAVLVSNGGYIGDYMGGERVAKMKAVPHIAIPTTAGTGSEATDVAVIQDTKNDVKMMIKQPAFLPEAAIVDPVLTKSAPKHVIAATGVDALSHAIESYISRRAHPMTDIMALSAMELIVNNITKAYEEQDNIDAMEQMIRGSLQAGLAFSNASVCLVHGMSRPIGALFHVPHGFSNAMLLPAVLEYSKNSAIRRLADLGRIFRPDLNNESNEALAEVAVTSVKRLCKQLDIPNLNEWGIDNNAFESAVSKMAADALESGSPGNNPKVPSQKEIEELYHVCFNYNFTSEVGLK
ncbi:iron-containing alcohol dehydrogenase [Lentibacillus lipolyticus]|nr:iron-containing alcohol dehydrogenase [Lentibacillus lipolyticus]